MKFVFINPSRNISKKNIWNAINSIIPPLGLATLAALLLKEGHEAEIIDAYALELEPREIISRIDPETDYVGLSATTPEIKGICAIAAEVRKAVPNVPIIFGGVHPTIFHEQMLAEGHCDIVVRGEGEDAISMLASGAPITHVPNLTWCDAERKVVKNPDSSFADLDHFYRGERFDIR